MKLPANTYWGCMLNGIDIKLKILLFEDPLLLYMYSAHNRSESS